MRFGRFIGLLAVLLLASGSIQAQTNMAEMLGVQIDNRVELAGFPTTGSQIQAARQAVAENINTEINNVVEQIGELEGTSPVGRVWVEEIDQAVNANTPQTAGEQFISYGNRARIDAATGQDSRPVVPEYDGPPNPIVQRIGDAVRDLFRGDDGELPTYQPSDSTRPQTQLEMLMEKYGKSIAEINGDLALIEQDRRRLAEAVADGAGDAIDGSNVPHKNLTKRIIRRYIQVMTASQELPISGYWRVLPFEYKRSGDCKVYICDGCGGGVVSTREQDPGQPLCGYDNPAGLPFIFWHGREYPYLEGTSNIYGTPTEVEIQVARDSNGKTTGNVRTERTEDYEVVAPDKIIVHDYIREIGGCSVSADIVLELVRQDETVCNITELPADLTTPEPISTPVPGETKKMRVMQQIVSDEKDCNETNTPPAFDEVTLTPNADFSLTLDYGSGKQILYSSGGGYYEFSTGTSAAVRQSINLVLYNDRPGGSLSWSIQSQRGGPHCYVTRDLVVPGMEAQFTPTPVPESSTGTNGSAGSGDTVVPINLLPGRYKAEWMNIPGLCVEDLIPVAPHFDEVMVALPDASTVTLDYGSGPVALSLNTTNMYFVFNQTETLSGVTSLSVSAPDEAAFGWTVANTQDSSKTCVVMATLTRIGD